MKVGIQSGSVEVETGARYAVAIRSSEFGSYDFEGKLTEVHAIRGSAYSGASGFDFLSFVDVIDLRNGERVPLEGSGRGARDFTIARLTKLD